MTAISVYKYNKQREKKKKGMTVSGILSQTRKLHNYAEQTTLEKGQSVRHGTIQRKASTDDH